LDKARQPYEFLSSVYGYELTGPNIGYWIAFLVPWVEMSCGLGLIIGVWQYGSLLITAVLLGVFALAQARAVSKGLSIPCGCGVVMASNLTYMKVLETAFLSASAFVCLVVEVAQSVRRTRVTY
jgi:phosphate/sulfate permease